MVGAGCMDIFAKMFVHQSEGGGRVSRGDALGFVWFGVRREIGRLMSTDDIRGTASIRMIKAIKLKIKSLNEMSIIFGVTFVLNAN